MVRVMWLVGAVGLVGACAQRPVGESGRGAPAVEARSVAVLDGEDGQAVSWDAFVDAAAHADVVIIGEMHGHEVGLPVAAALWEDVLVVAEAEGLTPALSLEFFERDEQVGLDDYLTGVTDEEEFEEATGRRGSNYPEGHRAMVEAAKAHGARVYASNAPRRYATLARSEGYERLEDLERSQRRLFVVPRGEVDEAYKDRFFEQMSGMMSGHGGGEEMDEEAEREMIEGFFRAQSVWDATMASTINAALAEGRRPVVHVVGRFHSDDDGGLVQRLRARRDGVSIVTVSMVEGEFGVLVDEDVGRATFVVPVGPGDE